MFYQYNKSHFDGFFQTRPFLPEVFVYSYMFLPLLYGFENYQELLFAFYYLIYFYKNKDKKQKTARRPKLPGCLKIQVHYFVFLYLPKLHPRCLRDQLSCFLDTIVCAVDAQVAV